jgi:hypothetical protein
MSDCLPSRLRRAATTLDADRVSLQQLADAHGSAALGSWLILLALPCVLPVAGVGTVLGFGLLALAAALWRGQQQPQLPARVSGLALKRVQAAKLLHRLADFYAFSGRWARERAPRWLRGERSLSLKLGFMAVLIILPMPLGNVLPALSVSLLGLALAFRDGLAALLAWVAALLAAAYAAALALGAASLLTQLLQAPV